MKAFQTKFGKLTGTDYSEVYPKAKKIYRDILRRTKRKPYVRSKYFKNQKIFLDYFWQHLQSKNRADRNRRLKFYLCAIDLIKNTRFEPFSKQNPNNKSEIIHRFTGITSESEIFHVQIKEDKKTDQKHFISVFPDDK